LHPHLSSPSPCPVSLTPFQCLAQIAWLCAW
jgi:hypothetical protein